MTVVKNYVVTRLQYHSLSLSCHQDVILSEVPDWSWFSGINPGGYGKMLYLYILTIHDCYLPSSVVILILHSKVRSYGYVHVTVQQLSSIDRTTVVFHVTGQLLSSMWQDNSCRACGRTTDVVLVTGQQLSCMWQDNSCSACDRTTAVHMKGQQLSCMWQDNSCRDRFYDIFLRF